MSLHRPVVFHPFSPPFHLPPIQPPLPGHLTRHQQDHHVFYPHSIEHLALAAGVLRKETHAGR
jgi:hypothetical protein